jgi:molecular chaperone DnaK (HSP70)
LSTSGEGPSEIRLHLVRGVSERLAQNHSIGWFRISGLPAGAARALVEFSISDGAILAGVVDATNAQPLPFTRFEPAPAVR